MGLGFGAWALGKALQESARSGGGRSRQAERLEAAWARAGGTDPVGEALACPGCKARYGFGYACPDCGLVLVSESVVDATQGEAAWPPRSTPAEGLTMVAGLVAAVLWIPLLVGLARLLGG
ncbi:MAG: hypothetical protein H6742_05610 [Alphaproteobacteria bacterium]|nr:hypothetical protein [Alphaproteobacteria bacterium]